MKNYFTAALRVRLKAYQSNNKRPSLRTSI